MAAITIIAIVILAISTPGDDTKTITLIIGVSSPIILMLLSVGLQGIHALVNNNLAEVKATNASLLEKIDALQVRAVRVAETSAPIVQAIDSGRNIVGDIARSQFVAPPGAMAAVVNIPAQAVDASAVIKK